MGAGSIGCSVLLIVFRMLLQPCIPILLPHFFCPGSEILVQCAESKTQRRKLGEILRVFVDEIHDVPATLSFSVRQIIKIANEYSCTITKFA